MHHYIADKKTNSSDRDDFYCTGCIASRINGVVDNIFVTLVHRRFKYHQEDGVALQMFE